MSNELDQTGPSQVIGVVSQVIRFAEEQAKMITRVLEHQSKSGAEGVAASQGAETPDSGVWKKAATNREALKTLQELGNAAQKIQQKIMSADKVIDSDNAAGNAPTPTL